MNVTWSYPHAFSWRLVCVVSLNANVACSNCGSEAPRRPSSHANAPVPASSDGSRAASTTAARDSETKIPECPAGMVALRSPADGPVASFCLARTETTVSAFAQCVKEGACAVPKQGDKCNWAKADFGDHPINCVTQLEATHYCQQLRQRLPTQEEWKFAITKGDALRIYPWGSAAPSNQICWKRGATCPVATNHAGDSVDGVSDLSGNVLEWTASAHPTIPNSYFVAGGDWQTADPAAFRVDVFQFELADSAIKQIGFRCAASLQK